MSHRRLSFKVWKQRRGTWLLEKRVVPWVLAVLALVVLFLPPVRTWANDHQGAVTAAAGLAATTFAWFTLEIVRQGRESLNVAKVQAANQYAPVLAIEVIPGGGVHQFQVKISNVGNGVALTTRFGLNPANVQTDGMRKPSDTLPMDYEMQPDGNEPIGVLAAGAYALVSFTAPDRNLESDVWDQFETHPLVTNLGIVSLGDFKVIYSRIDQVEMRSSCVFEWNKTEDRVFIWGINVSGPTFEPPSLPVVDTKAWRRLPWSLSGWFNRKQ